MTYLIISLRHIVATKIKEIGNLINKPKYFWSIQPVACKCTKWGLKGKNYDYSNKSFTESVLQYT